MLKDRLDVSERRACLIAGQHRSTQRRNACVASDDGALRAALRALSRKRPRWGYRRAHARLLEEGWSLNRKRTQRLWREEGLRVPQRRRKRQRLGESTVPASRLRAERPDHVWALDFQYDQTADGRIVKLVHVVDEFTREALEMKCERRIDADSTVVTLDGLVAVRGGAPELRAVVGHRLRYVRAAPQLGRGYRFLYLAAESRAVVVRQAPLAIPASGGGGGAASASWPLTACISGPIRSIGSGKTIVEFCSLPISSSVCR